MNKCGKNWGYINEIEEIQVAPHFRNKLHVKLPKTQSVNPFLHSETPESKLKMLQKLRLAKEIFIFSDCIIYCKIKEFSSYSSSI